MKTDNSQSTVRWEDVVLKLKAPEDVEMWESITKYYLNCKEAGHTLRDLDMENPGFIFMTTSHPNYDRGWWVQSSSSLMERHEIGKYQFYYVCYGDPQIVAMVFEDPQRDGRLTVIPFHPTRERTVWMLSQALGMDPGVIRLAAIRSVHDKEGTSVFK